MPELPEVETMVRGLRPALVERALVRVEIRDPSMLEGVSAVKLEAQARGATVAGVFRRGKWVAITLGGSRGIIVIQPRMTGGFWLVEPDRLDHIRLVFHLERPSTIVWYCDTRRLGRIAWYADLAAAEAAFARSHGPDALAIRVEELRTRLGRTSRAIKPALMDQKIVAGIGNIYADEILHAARLHPERPANRLKPADFSRIHTAMRAILTRAIELEGSSFDAGYRTVLALEGGFLAENSVYGRAGAPCPTCARPIVKTNIAGLLGRPTHFCPRCQRKGARGPRS